MTRTNATTQAVLRWLNYNGFTAWRNNSGAVFNPIKNTFIRNKTSLKGTFDIIGFRNSDGKHIEIEVKTGRDRMSDHQIWHMTKLVASNCIVLIVKDFDDFERQIKLM